MSDTYPKELDAFYVTSELDTPVIHIVKAKVEFLENGLQRISYIVPKTGNLNAGCLLGHTSTAVDYCRTREEAIIEAEKMRKNDIRELLKKIELLLDLKFE